MRLLALVAVLGCAAAAHAGRAALETELAGDPVQLPFRPLTKGTIRATLTSSLREPLVFELVDPAGKVRAVHRGLITVYTLESACDPAVLAGPWGVRVSTARPVARMLAGGGSVSLSVYFPTRGAERMLTSADVAALAVDPVPAAERRAQLEPLVALLRKGDTRAAARGLAALVRRQAAGAGERAESAHWVRWVLHEAFLSRRAELLVAARKFRKAGAAEATLLAEVERSDKLLRELRAGMRTTVQLLDPHTLRPGERVLVSAKELRAYHDRIRDALEAQQAQLILARVKLERRMDDAHELMARLAAARLELLRAVGLGAPD
ncbi:MAG: hypothetical protein O7C98_16750 [Planctomycetota bacterium]|nr:hypothetical protein [Planctomycetota bacterium]